MRATDGHYLAPHVVIASTCGALAIAAFLLARRAAGAFSSPLPVLQLIAVAIVAVVWALVVRELSSRSRLFMALAIAVLLMFALACSFPGARVIDWLAWPTAMFSVVLCPPLMPSAVKERRPLKIATAGVDPDGEANTDQVLQQLTRVRTADGQDAVHGTLVGEFAAGERQTTLYIAFCPPFERLPQVEANVADDSDASVKLTQVLHNGAQFEVRLPQAADGPANVTVEFYAAEADPLAEN